MIQSLRDLENFAQEVVPECAAAIRAVVSESIAQGEDPYGKAWKTRKKDGAQALQGASQPSKLGVAAVGKSIVLRVRGFELMHHLGVGRGRVQRKIIPDGGKLPAAYVKAIVDVAARHFKAIIAGDT